MKIIRLILLLTLAFAAGVAFASDEQLNFKTIDGREFKNVVLSSKDPTGIRVMTEAGIEHISFEKLSAELQSKFGYDPKSAAQYAEAMAASAAAKARAVTQAAEQARLKKERSALEAKAEGMRIVVVEVLPRGVIATPLIARAISSGAGRLGGGGGAGTRYEPGEKEIYIEGFANGTEGQRASLIAYRDGVYYIVEADYRRTLEKWVCLKVEKE